MHTILGCYVENKGKLPMRVVGRNNEVIEIKSIVGTTFPYKGQMFKFVSGNLTWWGTDKVYRIIK